MAVADKHSRRSSANPGIVSPATFTDNAEYASGVFRDVNGQLGWPMLRSRCLVKPATRARFAATMKRLVKRLHSTSSALDETIAATTSRGTTVLHLGDIDWIEAAGNYAQLWIGSRSYFLRESLQMLDERVCKYDFIRAHRRALMRLGGVREPTRTRAGALVAVLDCGAQIPISRRRRAASAKALRLFGRNF